MFKQIRTMMRLCCGFFFGFPVGSDGDDTHVVGIGGKFLCNFTVYFSTYCLFYATLL
jgi:hypothetical protein